MENVGLLILTTILFLVTAMFHAGIALDFIRPTTLQVQLLGVHLTLFGGIVLLAFDGPSGFGFTIGVMGLLTGLVGSFKESYTTK